MRFYTERRNVTNKKGLFYAKFVEFEEFFYASFFCCGKHLRSDGDRVRLGRYLCAVALDLGG